MQGDSRALLAGFDISCQPGAKGLDARERGFRVSGDFPSFGHALKYLRRRARLTQRELGLEVGYSEAQICRLEQNRRLPDPVTLAALFLPALGLEREQALAARFLELAAEARGERRAASHPARPGAGLLAHAQRRPDHLDRLAPRPARPRPRR